MAESLQPCSAPSTSPQVPAWILSAPPHLCCLTTAPHTSLQTAAPLPPALLQMALIPQHLPFHLSKPFVCNSQPFSRLLCSNGRRAVGVSASEPVVPAGAVNRGWGWNWAASEKCPCVPHIPLEKTCTDSLLVFSRVFVECLGLSSKESQSMFLWLLAHPWAAGRPGAPTSLHFPPKWSCGKRALI